MNDIKDRILEIRKKEALTQKQFAESLGITMSYASRIERGVSTPSESLLRLICLAYKVPLGWLQTGTTSKEQANCSSPLGFDIALLKDVVSFRDERDWKKFHTPKDLAISLSLEAAELLECFQWSGADLKVDGKLEQMKDELADIFIYGILMASSLNIEIGTIIQNKLKKNRKKYPIDKSYGNAKKYSEFA